VSEPIEETDRDPNLVLTRGSIVLTEGLWTLVRRDASLENLSESEIVRKGLAAHYGLPDSHVTPPRKRRGKEADRG
jgi:hypothetical protein